MQAKSRARNSSTVGVSHCSRLARSINDAPASARPSAISLPSPREPPVTSATLPERSNSSFNAGTTCHLLCVACESGRRFIPYARLRSNAAGLHLKDNCESRSFIRANSLFLFQLRFIPHRIHLNVIRVSRLPTLLTQPIFDVPEPSPEFSIRGLQCAFGIDAQQASDIHRDKKQVTNFARDLLMVRLLASDCFLQLFHFLIKFLEHRGNVRPVEVDSRDLGRHLKGFHNGRQPGRNAVEHRAVVVLLSFFLKLRLFNRFPVAQHFIGSLRCVLAEDMRMPADHLCRDALDNFPDSEAAFLVGDLTVKDDLKQQVAKLPDQLLVVAFVDGFHHFVGFFEHQRLEAFVCLLAVPRATARRAQPCDQLHKLGKLFTLECCGRFAHRPNLQDERTKSKGRRPVVSDRWSVAGGRWTVAGGRWPVDGGRWLVLTQESTEPATRPLTTDHRPLSSPFALI